MKIFERLNVYIICLAITGFIQMEVASVFAQSSTSSMPLTESISTPAAFAIDPDDDGGGGGGPVPANPVGTFNVSTNCQVITVTIASGGPAAGEPWFLHTTSSHAGAEAFNNGVAQMPISDYVSRNFYVSARYGGVGNWSQGSLTAYAGTVHGNLNPNSAMAGPSNPIEGYQTSFGVTNSQSSATYRLYKNGILQTTEPGSNNATVYFNNVNAAGTYSVKADFGCGSYVDIPGSRTIQEWTPGMAPAPNGTYEVVFNHCGDLEIRIKGNSPQTPATYSDDYGWYLHTGTPSVDVPFDSNNKALFRTSSSASTNFYVSALMHPTLEYWSTPQSIGSFTVSQSSPAVRNMTGDPDRCVGGEDIFGVENPQNGVRYELMFSTTLNGSYTEIQEKYPVNGELSFDGVSTVGHYKVIGWYGDSNIGCSTSMTGVEHLQEKAVMPAPQVYPRGKVNDECGTSDQIHHNGYYWPQGQEITDPEELNLYDILLMDNETVLTGQVIPKNGFVTVYSSGVYYVRTRYDNGGSYCWSEAYPVQINSIGAVATNPIQSISTNDCGNKTVVINAVDGQTYGWSSIENILPKGQGVYEMTKSGNYAIVATTTGDCVMDRDFTTGHINVTQIPTEKTVEGGGEYFYDPEYFDKVKLANSEDGVTYQIYQNSAVVGSMIGNEGVVSSNNLPNGSYTVIGENYPPNSTEVCATPMLGVVNVTEARPFDINFSKTKSFIVPTQESGIDSANANNVIESITYVDGFGRTVQSIVDNATPAGKDVIQHVEYDQYGRVSQSYLPFVGDYDLAFVNASQALADQSDFYQTASDVVHDSQPFTTITYDQSPFNRIKNVVGPGQAWSMANKNASKQYLTNEATDQVINWKVINQDDLISDGVYAPGELYKHISTNEDDQQVVTFTNKLGQNLLKKVEAPMEDGGWALTYSVYDTYGNLRYVLPPISYAEMESDGFGDVPPPAGFYKVTSHEDFANVMNETGGKIAYTSTGSVTINAGTTAEQGTDIQFFDDKAPESWPKQEYLSKQIFQYKYDHRHRQIAKLVPGKGWEYMVYDRRDRLVLSQNAKQRLDDKWSFVKYDVFNRPIITGEKVIVGEVAAIRAAVENHNDLYETFDTNGEVNYTNLSYPANIDTTDILSVTYYDHYQFTDETFQLPAGVFDSTDYKIIPHQTTHGVKGLATGSMAKISGTTDQFVSTVNFYDDKYRLAQTVTKNHKGGIDRMTPQYQWRGLLMKTYVEHSGLDAAVGDIAITQVYTYDRMGRHLTTTHQLNSEPAKTIVNKTYNELGQVKNKSIADGYDETNYAYNIRGWITQMNDPNDEEDNLFEMEFKYQDAIHAKYDGNIGEVVWKNPFESATSSFDYEYDVMNRISEATGTGEAANNDLTRMKYDLNGNILELERKGTHEFSPNQTIDQLTYSYDANTNLLKSVADVSNKSTGFDDGNTEGDDFAYDANGNLIEDKNKGITSIEYNHLNQPTKVIYDANKYMEYTYAGAAKVSQKLVENGVEKVTDYIGSFIYENDSLQLIGHGEGRIIAERDVTGAFQNFEYQYHLRDHLGNVRVTFKTDIDTDSYLATMEDQDTTAIKQYFEKYDEVSRIKSALFDHTTDSTGYAIWLDGSTDREIGLAKSLKVKPGDVIDMEVFAKYYDNSNSSSWTALLNTVATNIAGGAPDVVYEAANNASGLPFADFLSGNRNAGEAPKAYLNYFVFDENYQLIAEKTGFQQISTAAEETGTDGAHEQLNHSIAIDKSGYVYIYLSNNEETPIDVFFDDFKVTQTHSPVVQKDDYYPFGLSFNSYTRAASTAQNFKFNAGSELEEMTDWYSTPFRKYDPSLGRFHGVDALAALDRSISPSHFAHNNPIMLNDPTGLTDGVNEGPGDMRNWDDANAAGGGGGNGGANDWARSRSNGSIYAGAFGRSAGAATTITGMIREAWAKTATNSASTTTYKNGNQTGFRSGGYWRKKSSGTYGGYEKMTINGQEVLVLKNDVVIEQEFVLYSFWGNIGDGIGQWVDFYRDMLKPKGAIVPLGDAGVGWPDNHEVDGIEHAEFMDTQITPSLAPTVVPTSFAQIIPMAINVEIFSAEIGQELSDFMTSSPKIDTVRISGSTTYGDRIGFDFDAYGPAVIRVDGVPQDTIRLKF